MRRAGLSFPATCLALLACSGATEGPRWFPLQTGLVQHYEVRYSPETGRETERWTLRNLGPQTWRGGRIWQRQHSAGVRFFLQVDAQGLRRVAHQTELDREPVADEQPQWVLKAPYAVGTEWSTQTMPYLLMRKNEHPRELKHSHKVIMNWRIVSVSAEVRLASGQRLAPCLHVRGEAYLRLYTDAVNGFGDVPLVSQEWYCQGLGLVRFSREETVPPGFMSGGALHAELMPG